jgi:hypothetical protein
MRFCFYFAATRIFVSVIRGTYRLICSLRRNGERNASWGGLYLSPKLLNEIRLSLVSGDYAKSYTSLFLHSYLSHITHNLHDDHTKHQKFTQRRLSVLETTYPEMRRSKWPSSYQRTRAMPQLSLTLWTTNRRLSAQVAPQGPRTVRGKQEVFCCRKWLFKNKERLLGSAPPTLYGFPKLQ